jgi:hypothetical protein
VAITHTKVSALADDADTSLVRPSDWNAAHTVANDSLAIAHTAGLQTALNTLTAAATPGGSDTQVQFNDGGAFGASAAVTFLSPDTSWGGTVLKVYENDTSSAVLSAVSDNGDGWLGADSFNTINSSTGNLVTYGPSGLWLGRGRGSSTVRGDVLANDGLGMIKFAGICQSGVRFESAAHIGAEVKEIGTYIGANIVFGTKPMANSNPLYRMRLDADGGLVLRGSSTTDPTGGSMGAGTINAEGLYVDGVAVGAGGSVAGSDTQVQYNNGGAFGGDSGFTFNDTNKTIALGGGTVTADDPVLNLTQTWNNAAVTFNGIKLSVTDTASAAGSKFLLLQKDAVDRFWINTTGTTGTAMETVWVGGTTTQQLRLYNSTTAFTLRSYASGTAREYVSFAGNGGITVAASNAQPVTLNVGTTGSLVLTGTGSGVNLNSPATHTLEIGGIGATTNAQTLRLYNTYTNTTNYERVTLTWASNVCYLKPENLGTGSARLFVPVTGSTTVGSLPAAATAGAGARSFVTDATATTFLSTVAGGGANAVPVVSDGTNWLIG